MLTLLADNQLLALSANSGATLGSVRLSSAPRATRDVARLMALSNNGKRLVVLVSADTPGDNRVATVDVRTLQIQATVPVPGTGVTYRGLAVGSKTGRIYLFGNRAVGPDAGPTHGPPSDAVVTVLDPTATTVIENWTARPSAGRNWYVLRGAVSADERQLFISYHGPDAAGMDIFSIEPQGVRRCASSPQPESGCARIHGDFEPFGNGFLAATGSPQILELDSSGVETRTFDTKLENNHLMEFAVDRTTSTLYAAGSCLYVPGLSSVSLTSGKTQLLDPLGGQVCGERILAGADHLLVLLQAQPRAVLFVDGRTGAVRRQVTTPAEPIDALLLPG